MTDIRVVFLAAGLCFSCFPGDTLAAAAAPQGKALTTAGGQVPLQTLLVNLYSKYDSGQVRVPDVFSVAAAFKIHPEGHISGIRLTKSSGSREIDQDALVVLRAIGDSRALAPLGRLTSTTARLDVRKQTVSFVATGLAATVDEAAKTAAMLKSFIALFRSSQSTRNPAVSDLLALVNSSSKDRRVSLLLAAPKTRVNELLSAGVSRTSR
jgi:hypothetical protein